MKKTKVAMSVAFLLMLILLSVGSLLLPDREFSENENRYLASMPRLTIDNIFNGKFQNGLESYFNDQIAFRDGWITIKTAIQKAGGDTDIGGAYVGKDGYDFEKITEEDIDETLFEKNISYIKEYFSYCSATIDHSRLSFLLVPTSGLVLADKLPANAPLFDQASYIEKAKAEMSDYNFIDVREKLTAAKEDGVYYRTDHHWTSHGAFTAYQKWCESTETEFPGEYVYTVTMVTDAFRGSLYSKILDYDSAYDEIHIYERTNSNADLSVTVNGESVDSIYFYDKLEEKDKYLFFFGDNYSEVVIHNDSPTDGSERNLLVVKDSFANSFVPFLVEDYENIYMIDLRYSREDMQAYLTEHEITDVLVLYSISNFVSDKNIYKLKRTF